MSEPRFLTNRRRVLQGMGLIGGAAIASPLISSRAAFASTATWQGNILVVVSLRGGFDGLSAFSPIGDPNYTLARPTLAIPASRTLGTGDARFGMHPSMANLKPFWDSGSMSAVHAVGTPNLSRSHFQSTDVLERAAPGTSIRTGWLDRALGLVGTGSAFQAVHLGSGIPGQLYNGPTLALSTRGLKDIALTSSDWVGPRMATALQNLHTGTTLPAANGALTILSALGSVGTALQTDPSPHNGATYPAASNLGSAFKDAARVIRADLGLQTLTIDFGEWDFHSNFGVRGDGRFADHLKELSDSLAAFATDLGTLLPKVTVVTVSEFGRRVAENGSSGVDHGHGNVMMLLGGGLAQPGKVLGTWPGLDQASLVDGDLAGTTDYRNVMADILVKRCTVPESNMSSVFPGLSRASTGAY